MNTTLLLPLPVLPEYSKPNLNEESRILHALAVAYLNGQPEIDLDDLAALNVLAVTRRLIIPNAAGYVLGHSFSLAVFFQSQRAFALRSVTVERDRMRFIAERRRFISPRPMLPPSVGFTGELRPLFDLDRTTH